jgi:hypothetical protein
MIVVISNTDSEVDLEAESDSGHMGAVSMTVVISDNSIDHSMGKTHPSTLVSTLQDNSERSDESGADQRDQPCQYTAADFEQFQIDWLDQ